MEAPDRRLSAGQRHIDRTFAQCPRYSRRLHFLRPLLETLLQQPAYLVAARPNDGPLLGREVADGTQGRVEGAAPAQVVDAPVLERRFVPHAPKSSESL